MAIEVGMHCTGEVVVDETNVAKNVGSGHMDVFSTPMLIMLMEQTAANCVQPHLTTGQATVGTRVAVSHTAATPIGMKVTVTATVTKLDGKRIEFDVEAKDEKEPVGNGTHTRYIIDEKRFLEKTYAKLNRE